MEIRFGDIAFFESKLMGQENDEIKYKIDNTIEAQVKYDFLCECYGKDQVDKNMDDKKIDILSLLDISEYDTIITELENNK